MTELQSEMTTRDFLIDILDRLERIETKQDVQGREFLEVRGQVTTNSAMIRGAWAVMMLLVTGIIGLAFFVLQSSLRFPVLGLIK